MLGNRRSRSADTSARRVSAIQHAALVVCGFAVLFAWVFARPITEGTYFAESDLLDEYLPALSRGPSYTFCTAPA